MENQCRDHTYLRADVDELKDDRDAHDGRLNYLEKKDIERSKDVENLLKGLAATNKSIDCLVGWMKWGLAFLIPSWIGMFVWLLQQQIVR